MPEPTRDVLWIVVHIPMKLGEVEPLPLERVDLQRRILRMEETNTGEVLELPITDQLAAVFGHCRALADVPGEPGNGWLFPLPKSASGAWRTCSSSTRRLARWPARSSGSTG